jgi:hypothetical protein
MIRLKLAIALGLFPSLSLAQSASLERVLGVGDLLPNGLPFFNASWAVIEGDTIAFLATDGTQFNQWICTMDLTTRVITIHAGPNTQSPTYPGNNLKLSWGPTLANGVMVFPARALSNSQMEGIYTPNASGGVDVVVDQLHPQVNFPTASVTDGTSVLFRDNGFADERIGHALINGGFVGWLAVNGDAEPGGGTFFEFEPPALAGGLGAFQARFNLGVQSLQGIFTWDRATNTLARIATQKDPLPGTPHTMTSVIGPSTDGKNVAFMTYGGPFPTYHDAIVLWDGQTLTNVFNDTMPLPEANGKKFTVFNLAETVIDDGNLAFAVFNEGTGFQGAYAMHQGQLVKLVDSQQPIFGLSLYNISMRYHAMSGNRVAMVLQLGNCCSNGGIYIATIDAPCAADCDADGSLTIDDFICFQTLFALGDPSADCDADGALTIDDFICFQTLFAIGC